MEADKNLSKKAPYNPAIFREWGHGLVDQIYEYLKETTENSSALVTNYKAPMEQLADWQLKPGKSAAPLGLFKKLIEESIHLHSPRFMGHQNAVPLPVAALTDFLVSFLNNSNAIYEMGPASSMAELNVIDWMARKIGYPEKPGGFFTSGGTLGNLTALLAARQHKAGYDIWFDGHSNKSPNLALMTSDQAHYSVDRAAKIMGLGSDGVVKVPTDSSFRIKTECLEQALASTASSGKKVIAVVASCGTTSTGSYDRIESIADFCEYHNLWLHVDGAHGAAAILSPKFKHLLAGISRADSIVWDAHKMLLMPALSTAVLFKNAKFANSNFTQQASYLLEKSPEEEWYNICHNTLECTKRDLSFKLYVALSLYGEEYLSDYVTDTYNLARTFSEILKSTSDFEIPVEPESNIVVFRYKRNENTPISDLQSQIRKELLRRGNFYIVQTTLPSGIYLRVTLMNPFTKETDLIALLNDIRGVARGLHLSV